MGTGTEYNNKSYSASIVLTKVADGKSATSKILETDYDEILKFVNGENDLSFSPDYLKFQLFDLSSQEYDSNFDWSCAYLSNEGFVEFATSSGGGNYSDAFLYADGGKKTTTKPANFNAFYLDPHKLYNLAVAHRSPVVDETNIDALVDETDTDTIADKIEAGMLVLKITTGYSKATAIKYIAIKNGISADMATLNIGAKGISAAVRESSLEFTGSGLTLFNGDFTIYDYKYKEVEVEEANFVPGKYYVLNSNNKYTEAPSPYDPDATYYERTKEPVFYQDQQGNLTLSGVVNATGGNFEGIIKATGGEFTGTVIAKGGDIGGFSIEKTKLISADRSIILDGTNGKIVASNIELGSDAKVVDKIIFHSGDTDPTFTLYNPLYDTDRRVIVGGTDMGGKILSAAQIKMTNRGYLLLGTLEFFGGTGNNDGYIRSLHVDSNSQTQDGWWRINENGTSYFETIHANNAHLKNTIMEQRTVQSIGSTMIFKESWAVTGHNNEWHTLGDLANLKNNDYVMIEGKFYKVAGVTPRENLKGTYWELQSVSEAEFNPDLLYIKENEEYKHPTSFSEEEVYYVLHEAAGNYTDIFFANTTQPHFPKGTIVTKIGTGTPDAQFVQVEETKRVPGRQYYEQKGSDKYVLYDGEDVKGKYYLSPGTQGKDCVIAIQGSEDDSQTGVADLAAPQTISFSSFYNVGTDDEPQLAFTKHLVLGKFSGTGIDELVGFNGYGLYADHVFLNGSLVTENAQMYAGINTQSSAKFANPNSNDTSNIIFWGGAQGTDKTSISNAKFQVTENGTLYAQNAIIQNSVLVGGEISAATLRTAQIFGEKDRETAALTIHDAKKGIVFKSGHNKDDSKNATVLTIGEDGFFNEAGTNFLSPNEDYPTFYGIIKAGHAGGYQINYVTSGIGFDQLSTSNEKTDIGKIKPYRSTDGEPQIVIDVGEGYRNSGQSEGVISFRENKVVTNVNQYFHESLFCGRRDSGDREGTYIMELKKSSMGYDIIIT